MPQSNEVCVLCYDSLQGISWCNKLYSSRERAVSHSTDTEKPTFISFFLYLFSTLDVWGYSIQICITSAPSQEWGRSTCLVCIRILWFRNKTCLNLITSPINPSLAYTFFILPQNTREAVLVVDFTLCQVWNCLSTPSLNWKKSPT